MSNQHYEGNGAHEPHDPYQQHQQHQQNPQPQAQPQAGWQQQYADADEQQQYTQQWEGQTWETRIQPQVAPAADTAYLPSQAPQGPQGPGEAAHGDRFGAPQPYASQYGAAGPMPAEAGWGHGAQAQGGHTEPAYGGYASGQAAAPAAPAPASAPAATATGYGPPTLTGNSRVTDAQRARAEGRSPIIEPGAQPAALTAVLALLLAGAAAIGEYALAVPLVILQAVTAAGWFRLNGMWPARQGIALAFAGALTSDVVLLGVGRENAAAAILGTLGVWVLLTLVIQLRSRAEPDERMYGLMATVASAALAIVATGHLGAEPDAVTVGAIAVAAAVLARAVPLPTPVSVAVALLAAAGAGAAAGAATGVGTAGALLGAGAGVCALIGHRVASYDYPSKFVHMTAGVALPLAAAAPAVYFLGRALV
ncbi:hypothetical protein [Streptomyces fructofermentans]|uniref:Uncharacterized protein n=1 Tax=Streptomyces fructofermentans TaxID=152141 RepID=A0A918N8I0_9ACTN|nr:hypothetical protein [Streptomyces fructofermentans]GGX47764.1 hypothetical protein GCM10010515_13570 [Streptomyces fructofermentans]